MSPVPTNRVQPGVPTGGQFAPTTHAESDVELTAADAEETPLPPLHEPEETPLPSPFEPEEVPLPSPFEPEKSESEVDKLRSAGFPEQWAKEWVDKNFDAAHAEAWSESGFGPTDAHEWTALGVDDPKEARRWTYAGPGTTTPERTRPWVEAGFGDGDQDEADGWASYGFEARDAGMWRAAGFEHHESVDWRKTGYEPGQALDLRAEGFHPSKLSPTLHRTGRAPFKVKDSERGVIYEIQTVSEQDAADHGCPGATHRMLGEHETRYGRMEALTGKRVAVPGWTAERKGVTADFVCDEDPDFQPLRGYLGE